MNDPHTHRAFLERMLDLVARAEVDGARPLHAWTTRSTEDPGIALLSAQAGVAHVLAWNLRRLYADGTLTESEDADALLLLTRLLGHRRRPAVSATTVLSFELETLEGSPSVVTVPRGTKVSTIPESGEQPQVFETDADLEARREWNRLLPLRGPQAQTVSTGTTSLRLTGTGHPVRVGDHVLAWSGQSGPDVTWVLARVTEVGTEDGSQAAGDREEEPPSTVLAISGGLALTAASTTVTPGGPGTVVILGQRALPFGAVAPDIAFMPEDVQATWGDSTHSPLEWKDFTVFPPETTDCVNTDERDLYLDAVHAAAAVDRVAVFAPVGATTRVARVTSAIDVARSAFGLSARATRISVAGLDCTARDELDPLVRSLSILLETARAHLVVTLADPDLPVTGPGPGQHPGLPAENLADRLYLVGVHQLSAGRTVVLAGADASTGEARAESAVVVAAVPVAAGSEPDATLLRLQAPLVHRFRASSLHLSGNSVQASQGESAPPVPAVPGAVPGAEVLGSGYPAVALPRFLLNRPSLAHVPGPGASGHVPAIEVRVDGGAYELVDRIAGETPDSRGYQVLPAPGHRSEVQFAGRLPSGVGNVTASYRTGGGRAGNLPAGRLVQVLTPVLGIRSADNLVPAEGGSDPETAEEISLTAPRAIRTLGRAVALADFAAFAEGYRGVGAASATKLRVAGRRTVVLTVATTALAAPLPGSQLLTDLRDALQEATPPGTRLRVIGFDDLPMSLTVALAHDPALVRTDVEDRVRSALTARFGPGAQPFARAVHRSEVLATVQSVPGVVAARLTAWSAGAVTEDPHGRLPCPGPVADGSVIVPAGRLTLTSATLEELIV